VKKAAAVGIGIAIAIVIAAGVYAMSGTLIGEPSEPVGVGDEVEGTIEEPEEQPFLDEIIVDVEEEIGTGIEQTP